MRRLTKFVVLLLVVSALVMSMLPASAVAKMKEVYIVAYNTTSGAWEVLDKGDLLRPTVDAVLTIKYDAAAYMTITQANGGAVTFDSVSDGTAGFKFSDPVTFGSVVSVGVLGGAGTSASSQTLGAGGSGVKAFSYYLSTTSTTASNSQTGLYLNMDYGTVGTSAAPSGDAIRGRAYLKGDASGAVALTGGAFTVEHGAGSSHAGLETGLRGNIVLADEALPAGGTYYGSMAEICTGGASSSMAAVTDAAILGLSLSGTAPTSAAQLSNVSVFSITLPANEIGDDLIVDDTASDGTVGAKMRIRINGTYYWIMLADDAN